MSAQAGMSMKDTEQQQEWLSALVDGELTGSELEQALAQAEHGPGQHDWQLYHLIGDVLRSPDLAHHSQHDLLTGLRAQLAQEPALQPITAAPLSAPAPAPVLEQIAPPTPTLAGSDPAANQAIFRWRMAAGFATVAAVAAVGWHLLAVAPSSGAAGGQWAQAPAAASNQAAPVVAVAAGNGSAVMLRDPRLDALMASQQRYSPRPNVQQVSPEFLRNASLSAMQER